MVPAAGDKRGHYQRERKDPGLMPALPQHVGSSACHTTHAPHQTETTGAVQTVQGGAGVLLAKPQQQIEVVTHGRATLRHHIDLDMCTRTHHLVEV